MARVGGLYPYRLQVARLRLAVPDLPLAFEGYRIVQISDLHLGPRVTQQRLPAVVAAALDEHPDLIALTGDYISRGALLATVRDALARLAAPDGVWAVLGNHDYAVGARRVSARVEEGGARVLCNRHHVIARGDSRLVIAGLDDAIFGRPNLHAALDGAPPGAPVILLVHEPDSAIWVAASGRVTLQLSGHTHGGQVRLVGIGALILPQLGKFYSLGAYRLDDLALYVSPGTGFAGRVPLRLNCPPEITAITLVRGPRWKGLDGAAWREGPYMLTRRR